MEVRETLEPEALLAGSLGSALVWQQLLQDMEPGQGNMGRQVPAEAELPQGGVQPCPQHFSQCSVTYGSFPQPMRQAAHHR